MIILDTNVVSELSEAEPDPLVDEWFAGHDESEFYLTAISEAEVRYGLAVMPRGRRRDSLVKRVEYLLGGIFRGRILPFDSAAARAYAVIAAEQRLTGRPTEEPDCRILSIASVHHAIVATRNVKHFEGYGVEVVNPWDQR